MMPHWLPGSTPLPGEDEDRFVVFDPMVADVIVERITEVAAEALIERACR